VTHHLQTTREKSLSKSNRIGSRSIPESIQGFLYVAWSGAMLTALSLHIIQNQYYAESGLENEILGNIALLTVMIALFLTVPYTILFRKNCWGKRI
jgi:hypothetical protein